jgi:hypothetical protein
MKSSFWKALEALGASGSAVCNWRHHLGADWDACRPFLMKTGRAARHVVDPKHPQRMLDLMIDGEEDFVAVDDDTSIPPIPYKAAEVEEMQPLWDAIAQALAIAIRFDFGGWETQGTLRQIGTVQDPFGRVSQVLLFMPPGYLGDYHGLLRMLQTRTTATVLLPTRRWFTADLESLGSRNRLEFVAIAEHLTHIEANPAAARLPLPVIGRPSGPAEPKARAALHGGNGLTWSQVRIEIMGNQTIRLTAPGQEGSHSFSKRLQLGPEHPLGILMTLAAKGEWRNPPIFKDDYQRVAKAFYRLQRLLRALVPVPGKPFRPADGAFIPLFQVMIHTKLRGG